jgi:peptide/nickel transport system substrate-binding protein
MRHRSKLVLITSAVAVALTVLSACSSSSKPASTSSGASSSSSSTGSAPATASGYNAAFASTVNPSTTQGGTLNLISTTDCDSWDPARTYYGWCWNMQRLFTRSLLGYSVLNGTKFTLAPDLATDMGTSNATKTQWSFTLKSGLKWQNGTPITPMDVKWGIERMFATDQINGGPTSYFLAIVSTPKNYAGPYKDGDLASIVTTSDTITFNLSTPYADFPYLMAMAASAPVPYKTEGGAGLTGANYGKMPMASGPFEIQSYTPATQITFVRNPNWSQATDTIHKPLVNKVVLTIDTNPTDADAKLKAGTEDANASAAVTPGFQADILTDASLKKNADDPVGASTQYLAIMPSVITNADCRKAIFYATDKNAILRAYGGDTGGVIANSMTPPGITGYNASANVYPDGSTSDGDLTAAKAALTACGQPNGFSTKLAYATPGQHAAAAFVAEQAALARVGIKVTPATADGSKYYSTFIGSPANIKSQGLGIAIAGWGADFPSPYGFWNSIANGASILPTGNTNYPSLNDPVINTDLNNAPKGTLTESDWEAFDTQVMNDAVYLPLFFIKDLYYRNPRLTNVTSDNVLAFGIYDFVNVGVGGGS